MAEPEEKETPAAEEEEEAPKPNKIMELVKKILPKIINGAACIIAIALGYFLAEIVLLPMLYPADIMAQKEQLEQEFKKKADREPGEKITFADILVNPAGSEGEAIFLLSIDLEVKDQESGDDVEARRSEIQDTIIEYYNTISVQEFKTDTLRDVIDQEILDIINGLLSTGMEVIEIYYMQRYVQHTF